MCSWNSLSITFPFFLLTFIPWVVLLSPNYSRLPSLSHSILSSFGSLSFILLPPRHFYNTDYVVLPSLSSHVPFFCPIHIPDCVPLVPFPLFPFSCICCFQAFPSCPSLKLPPSLLLPLSSRPSYRSLFLVNSIGPSLYEVAVLDEPPPHAVTVCHVTIQTVLFHIRCCAIFLSCLGFSSPSAFLYFDFQSSSSFSSRHDEAVTPKDHILKRFAAHMNPYIWQGFWRGTMLFQKCMYDPGGSLTLSLYLKREKYSWRLDWIPS